jgi:hypothetical protein
MKTSAADTPPRKPRDRANRRGTPSSCSCWPGSASTASSPDPHHRPTPTVIADPVPTLTSAPSRRTPRPGRLLLPDRPGQCAADPEEFARERRDGGLFAWDTGTGFMPLDYTAVRASTSPTPPAPNRPASRPTSPATCPRVRRGSICASTPPPSTWKSPPFVPEAWATAETQAQPGQLAEGTTAITIEGVRHRAGVWNDEPVDVRARGGVHRVRDLRAPPTTPATCCGCPSSTTPSAKTRAS